MGTQLWRLTVQRTGCGEMKRLPVSSPVPPAPGLLRPATQWAGQILQNPQKPVTVDADGPTARRLTRSAMKHCRPQADRATVWATGRGELCHS